MNNKNRKGGPIRGIWLYVILFAGVLLGASFLLLLLLIAKHHKNKKA